MGIYLKILPGVKVRLTRRGVRWGLGLRALRYHFGSGGMGVSTGVRQPLPAAAAEAHTKFRRGKGINMKIKAMTVVAVAASAIALPGCGGGSSAAPAWCKPVVRDIEATAETAPNPDPGAPFQDQMNFEHNTDGAPAYVAKLGNDQVRLSNVFVSNGVTELGTAAGRAITTSDLKPIAAACRVPLKRLTYAMITSWQ